MTNLIDSRPTGPAAPLPPPRIGDRAPRRAPAAVRVLWKVFAALFVVGGLVWVPYQVVVLLAHEERIERSSYPAAGLTTLEVDGAAGSIRVEGTDGDSVEVRVEIGDGLRRTGESQTVIGDTLRLDSTCPNFGSDWCRVDYEISVPRDLELVLDGDDGSIALSELSGTIRASTDNGRIDGSRLRSSTVVADTDNGGITLEFAAPPASVTATADNGRVDVVVPDDGNSYRVDIETDNGRRDVSVPGDPSSPRSITIHTDNGSATARTSAG